MSGEHDSIDNVSWIKVISLSIPSLGIRKSQKLKCPDILPVSHAYRKDGESMENVFLK